MKASKVLFVDIDDTLLYWAPNFVEWFFKTKFEKGETFDTHDVATMFERQNYEPFNSSPEFLNRKPITPIYEFVKECLEQEDIAVIFTSACGISAKENQVQCITNLFPVEQYSYGLHICDHSSEKIEMINKLLTSQRITAMLLDDKRVTNSNVPCYATDSKDINHLRHMAHILWKVKADDKKTIKNRRHT